MASNLEALRSIVSDLVQVPDAVWSRSVMRRAEPSDAWRLCEAADVTAAAHWHQLTANLAADAPLTPSAQIQRYGVAIEAEMPGPLDGAFIHFATYEPGRRAIDVSTTAVAKVQSRITDAGLRDLLGDVSVMNVVLWHEYYHVWMRAEEKHSPAANKRRRLAEVWKGRGNESIERQWMEELGAMSFSKLASGLSYHPQVLQWLLVEMENPDQAASMLDHILEKSVMK